MTLKILSFKRSELLQVGGIGRKNIQQLELFFEKHNYKFLDESENHVRIPWREWRKKYARQE